MLAGATDGEYADHCETLARMEFWMRCHYYVDQADRIPVPLLCCGLGGLFIQVEKGKATGIKYMTDHPTCLGALCPKGNSVLELLNNQERL